MKRRDFLKFAGICGAGTFLPLHSNTRLFAAHDGYTGPLYLMIDARGGWDPTSFCDPKGYATGQTTGRINNYPASSTAQIGNIKYAPPPDSFLANTSLYTSKTFFEKYFQRLLIINGINTGTTSHSDGERVSWSGELGKTGYPNFAALVAGTLAVNRDIPFITNGGYDKTAGLVVPIRMNSTGIDALFEIAYPNRTDPKSASSSQYTTEQVEALIKASSSARQQSLLNNQQLPRIKDAISKHLSTFQSQGHLKDLANNFATIAEKPSAFFNGRNRARELYRQGRVALAAFETGVTATAHLSITGFDTHRNHDQDHYPRLMDFLQGIDSILQEASDRGLSDRIVVVVGSDFGRTNKYNADNGKDHWPITSMMMIGNSQQIITGNRVIGATTNNHKAIKVDKTTLATDPTNTNPNSIQLTPAHIHRSLRRLAGIEQSTAAIDFSIGGEDLNLF